MASVAAFGVPQYNNSGSDSPILMPKMAYRFRVTMFGFGNRIASQQSTFSSQVVSVSRPNLTHDEVVVDVYNSRIHLAGKHTWDPIQLVLRDDITGNVDKFVASQLQKQLNHASQSASSAGGDYKFSMYIEQLDGSNNNLTPGGRIPALDTWSLAGCFITNAQYGENNYADSAVTQITLSIRYDNADHDVKGQSGLLSSSTAGNVNTQGSITANGPGNPGAEQ
jgi:hypothetical protein